MDIGVISVRYARALLKASVQADTQQEVYRDMLSLQQSFIEVPQLRVAISNPMLAKADKERLLLTAAGQQASKLTRQFVELVLSQGRESIMVFMASAYISLYRKERNIIRGKLTTATPVSPELSERMEQLVKQRTSASVEFETKVDADIIGGFILEYDTYRLDSSVRSRLQSVLSRLKSVSIS